MSNLKKTWQILREAIRKNNDKTIGVSDIKVDVNLIEEGGDIYFNNYFTSVADKLSDEINPTDRHPDMSMINLEFEFKMEVVCEGKINDIVEKMEDKKSKDMFEI